MEAGKRRLEGSSPEKFYAGFHQEMDDAEAALEGVPASRCPEEETDEVCELCGRKMVIKSGRFGRFLACPGYPECKNTEAAGRADALAAAPSAAAGMLKRKSSQGLCLLRLRKGRGVRLYVLGRAYRAEDCPYCGQDHV